MPSTFSAGLTLACALFAANGATAQTQQPDPKLDQTLALARTRIAALRASLPDFTCDEKVVSRRLSDGKVKDQDTVDSTFRVYREGTTFHETRVKNLLNGAPVKSQKVSIPFTFNGGFGNVLGIGSADCTGYTQAPALPNSPPGSLEIAFHPREHSGDHPQCTGDPTHLSHATLDAATGQVLRLERTQQDVSTGLIGHLPFVPMPSSHNVFHFTITYAPVQLGDTTWYVPSQVAASLTDRNRPIVVDYDARYTACHRFTASSRIVSEEPIPPSTTPPQ